MARVGPRSSGSGFTERLGYYLVGVTIGLIMLMVIWQVKARAVRRQQQQQQQQQQPAVPPAPP